MPAGLTSPPVRRSVMLQKEVSDFGSNGNRPWQRAISGTDRAAETRVRIVVAPTGPARFRQTVPVNNSTEHRVEDARPRELDSPAIGRGGEHQAALQHLEQHLPRLDRLAR